MSLSDKEARLLALTWQHFETQPKINYATLGPVSGYANAQSCKTAVNKIKRKLFALNNSSDGTANDNSEDGTDGGPMADADDAVESTPAVPTKKRARSKKADDAGSEASPKKRGRKSKAADGEAAVVKEEVADAGHSETGGAVKDEGEASIQEGVVDEVEQA
ncbi:hypothetical protein B0A49_06339 [Cryomyces minteri]|uniref:Uncharacterized protein n=1 Tax=Cryomyces minteri TaxID=331657 RepID=A0A4U0X648_9PEZI|nr:hypothetical protein B0A49_06339 [Cryomyces minteri]